MVPFDQAVTEGQDVVISAKVSGQPTPMVHWWVLRSSILPADTEELLPQSKVTAGSTLLSTLTTAFCRLRSKDRVPVKTAGRFAVQQTDNGTLELRISSAQRSDAGLYACRIINESGSRQAECRVDVRGEQQRQLGCSVPSAFILPG